MLWCSEDGSESRARGTLFPVLPIATGSSLNYTKLSSYSRGTVIFIYITRKHVQ